MFVYVWLVVGLWMGVGLLWFDVWLSVVIGWWSVAIGWWFVGGMWWLVCDCLVFVVRFLACVWCSVGGRLLVVGGDWIVLVWWLVVIGTQFEFVWRLMLDVCVFWCWVGWRLVGSCLVVCLWLGGGWVAYGCCFVGGSCLVVGGRRLAVGDLLVVGLCLVVWGYWLSVGCFCLFVVCSCVRFWLVV